MNATKTARVNAREILWLHILRALDQYPDDQEYLLAVAQHIVKQRIEEFKKSSGNVILLSDPTRKFQKVSSG